MSRELIIQQGNILAIKQTYQRTPSYVYADGTDNNQGGILMPGAVEINQTPFDESVHANDHLKTYNPHIHGKRARTPMPQYPIHSYMGNIPLTDKNLDPMNNPNSIWAMRRLKKKLSAPSIKPIRFY